MADNKRMIDANAVAQAVRENNRENFTRQDWTSKDVCTLLENAPTVDAVEVVRCKDCKRCGFCGDATNLEAMGFYGYCSRGERRQP